jgi:threonylcarbamoyladenosine tRNA methylthiotransferase MtaB
MKKFKIFTLGCRSNQYESEVFSSQLKKIGFIKAKKNQLPDICIVNTCMVTRSAAKSSNTIIQSIKKDYPDAKIVITGCMASFCKKEENVLIIKDKRELIEVLTKKKTPFEICDFEGRTRAFIKIQEGCDNFCSYCVIPYVRNNIYSEPFDKVLKEVSSLVENGYKEIVLTGINLGKYSYDNIDLLALIKKLEKIEKLQRIRLSSINPEDLSNDLLDVIVKSPKVSKSLHISLQSGSNKILKKMRRNYKVEDFLKIVSTLKKRDNGFTFSTDIIVGFPGEEERDFEESIKVVKKVKFLKVHVFSYSDSDLAISSKMTCKVEDDIKKQRKEKLLQISRKESYNLRQTFTNMNMKVLIEGQDKKGFFKGHSDNFLLVKFKGDNLSRNKIVNVYAEKNEENNLFGQCL